MAITQGNTGSGGAGGSVTVTSLPSTPTGTNTIGKVDQGAGGASAWKVDGSAVIQPVSGTVAVSSLPTLPAGSNTLGKIDQGVGGVSAWKVDGSGVVQPVSGTVAVSSLPALPAGANAIGTVTANAGTGTFNMQATAAAPGSVELSDGTAFYTAAKTGQLPTALVSSRLDVNLGAAPAMVTVQGGAAAGAAVAGNPVIGAVTDGANAQAFKQANLSGGDQGVTGVPVVAVAWRNSSSTSLLLPLTASADSLASSATAGASQLNFNGGTSDRNRNNVDATLLASAARTTTQGPTTLTTYNLGAIIFVLDMTTVGTGSVTLTISEVDPASGKSILLLSGAAVTTNSTNVYTIDPMLTTAANSIAKARTPRTLSWTVTANNANPATYSLGAMELMP